MERLKRWTLTSASIVAVAGFATLGSAAELTVLAAVSSLGDMDGYASGGESTCLECHDETEEFPVLSILKTPHAPKADRRTPFAVEGCQACHGPSAAHVEDNDNMPGILFGSSQPAAPQSDVCLGCHQGKVAMHWVGGVHEAEGLSCTSCHTIHIGEEAGGDPILSKNVSRERAANSQAELCFDCHPQERAQSYRMSTHPIRYGQMNCSDCHSPHGSSGPVQLVKPTLNETCYRCHAEKRGPFLWEHAPVREDCAECHVPHGSNHRALLKNRSAWLCQQCHMAQYHPSTARTRQSIKRKFGLDSKLLDRDCLNCHFEVHGSNHPGGVRWTR